CDDPPGGDPPDRVRARRTEENPEVDTVVIGEPQSAIRARDDLIRVGDAGAAEVGDGAAAGNPSDGAGATYRCSPGGGGARAGVVGEPQRPIGAGDDAGRVRDAWVGGVIHDTTGGDPPDGVVVTVVEPT